MAREFKIEKENDRFLQLFEQSPIAQEVYDAQGYQISVNRAWKELWNTDPPPPGTYNVLQDPQIEAMGIKEHLARSFKGEEIHIDEVWFDPATSGLPGEKRCLRTSAYAIKNGNGEIINVVVSSEDITQRVSTNEALHESQIKLNLLIHNIPGMVYRAYPDWTTEIVAGCEEICGYSAEELSSPETNWLSIIHPEDKEVAMKAGIELTKKKKTTIHTYRIISKDGSVRWMEDHKTSFFSEKNEFLGIDGVVLDITERKQAEQKLKESEERYERVAINARDIIYKYRYLPQPGFDFISPAIETITGYTPEDHYSDPTLGLKVIHPDDRPRLEDVEKGYLPKSPQIVRWIGKDGKISWVEDSHIPIINEKGELVAIEGVARDITESKLTEIRIRKQASELQRTNQNLEQFAYISSHDIKAPVTNLDSLLHILEELDAIGEVGLPVFDKIKATVSRMNQTIRTLNEVFSVQSNLNLKREKVNLESTLLDVLDSVNNQINDSKAEISYDFEEVPEVKFPLVHLKSILQNLITNSIKYQKTGKIPRIEIKSEKAKNSKKCIITISDNGRGIDLTKYGTKVFGLFQRFHLDTEGKGMGLYLIKLILESYNGSISVESEPDKGTTFTLKL